jgi:hypothetical protein
MTRTSNARLAGIILLLYIATGIGSMILVGQITGGARDNAATLVEYAHHATAVRVNALLTFLQFFYAVGLAVTIYALTREIDAELALLAFCCRFTEGVIAAFAAIRMLGLLSIATTTAATGAPDAARTVGGMLLQADTSTALISATCFAVGSTIYCWLFLRSRRIPRWMAGLGVVASVLLVVALPLRILAFITGPVTVYFWMPMLVFELVFAFWLIFKGVTAPALSISATTNAS